MPYLGNENVAMPSNVANALTSDGTNMSRAVTGLDLAEYDGQHKASKVLRSECGASIKCVEFVQVTLFLCRIIVDRFAVDPRFPFRQSCCLARVLRFQQCYRFPYARVTLVHRRKRGLGTQG